MQLSYSSTRKTGLIGQKTDSSPSHIVSAFSESVIQPGSLVVFDTDKKCRLPTAKEDLAQALGIVLFEGFIPKPNSMLSILRSGRVWVEAGSQVSAGDPVFVNFKTNAFSNVTNSDSAKLKNAIFTQSAEAGAAVELEINLTGGVQ